jgi:hypothetical protein
MNRRFAHLLRYRIGSRLPAARGGIGCTQTLQMPPHRGTLPQTQKLTSGRRGAGGGECDASGVGHSATWRPLWRTHLCDEQLRLNLALLGPACQWSAAYARNREFNRRRLSLPAHFPGRHSLRFDGRMPPNLKQDTPSRSDHGARDSGVRLVRNGLRAVRARFLAGFGDLLPGWYGSCWCRVSNPTIAAIRERKAFLNG